MKRYFSKDMLWTVTLGFLFVFCFKLCIKGELNYYLHMKMFPFVYFMTLGLGVLFCFELWNLKNRDKASFDRGVVLFLIPICALMVKPASLQMDRAVFQRFDWSAPAFALSIPGVTKEKDYSKMTAQELGLITQDTLFYQSENKKDRFLSALDKIYDMERNDSEEYTLEGFVIKDETFQKDHAFIARTVITCCVADSTVDGVLCEGKEIGKLKNNQWVRVKGTVRRGEKKASTEFIPSQSHVVLEVSQVEEIEPIDPPYVYTY